MGSIEDIAETEEEEKSAVREDKRQQWRRRAQLLVTGNQDLEREPQYLIDTLLEATGKSRRWGTTTRPEDERQLFQIRAVIDRLRSQKNTPFIFEGTYDPQAFKQIVYDHAVGFMAPLIKNLTIHWPAPALQHGLTLVDLPGVGILQDAHKEVTRKWIREKARALVLVVDHRGITDSVGQALRQSEFLNSLLFSADEPADDPVLVVAVTRIDDIAGEAYRKDPSKRKFQHFLDISAEVYDRMRHDLQKQLDMLWLQSTEVTEARRKVAENLLTTLQVHPLSAPEYSRLMAQNEDERPFLQTLDQTGIPSFTESLSQLSVQRECKLHDQLADNVRLFRDSLTAQIQIIEAQWEEQVHAREEAEQLRAELQLFLQPLHEEQLRRQGAFHAFLNREVPQKIKYVVGIASNQASQSINQYLEHIGTAHWATLRASVKRSGRYLGATDINLPNEFALRFEEPIANAWSKDILHDLRTHTRDYGKDCLALADELTEWAVSQGGRAQAKGVRAQYDALLANATRLEMVGREMAHDMRDQARARLIEVIENKIEDACRRFVKAKEHLGDGTKERILKLYAKLAQEATLAAEAPARDLLLEVYRGSKADVMAAVAEFNDPLSSLADAIVVTEEQRIARTDARRREKIMAELRTVSEALPLLSVDQLMN